MVNNCPCIKTVGSSVSHRPLQCQRQRDVGPGMITQEREKKDHQQGLFIEASQHVKSQGNAWGTSSQGPRSGGPCANPTLNSSYYAIWRLKVREAMVRPGSGQVSSGERVPTKCDFLRREFEAMTRLHSFLATLGLMSWQTDRHDRYRSQLRKEKVTHLTRAKRSGILCLT